MSLPVTTGSLAVLLLAAAAMLWALSLVDRATLEAMLPGAEES